MPGKPWERYGGQSDQAPQPGAIPIGPRNNNQQRQSQQDALALRDQQIQEEDAAARRRREAREAAEWNAKFNPDGTPKQQPGQGQGGGKPAVTAKVREEALNAWNAAVTMDRLTGDLQTQFDSGIGSTSGLDSIGDYLPTNANREFDNAGQRPRAFVKQLLGFTGGEGNTASESQLNYGPYLPESWDRDNVAQGKIDALRGLSGDARRRAIAILGGVPDEAGNIWPVDSPEGQRILGSFGMGGQGGGSGGPGAGPNGGGGGGGPSGGLQILDYADPNSAVAGQQRGRIASGTLMGPEYRDVPNTAIQGQLTKMYQSGATFDQLNAFVVSQGYPPLSLAEHTKRVKFDAEYARRNGGRRYNGPYSTAPIDKVKQTTAERISQGAPGAAGIGYTNAASFGAVGALAPEQMQMSRQAHPYASAGGEIAGVFSGMKMGGNLLGAAASRNPMAANALARLRALPGASRNLVADAAYGTTRGAVENPDNPVLGAIQGGALATGGSVLGSAAARGVGATLGGLKQAPAVQRLLDAGIPLTTGQRLGGRGGDMLKRIEDRAMSVPVVGDVIRNRRVEGLQAFDQAARNEAGKPIGATFQPGGNWIDELPPQFGQAYDDATAGVSTQLDSTFKRDMGDVLRQGDQLPPDYRKAFEEVGAYRVTPAIQGGTLTGEGYQQAMRGLKAAKGKAANVGNSGFEDVYRDSLSSAQSALKGQMYRNAGPDVVEGLQNADEAYMMAKTLQRAQEGAVNGTQSGTPGIATPAQLNRSAIQTMRKYGTRPFAELGEAGQQVLPSTVPDSGTAGRLMQLAALPTIGGSVGYGTDAAGLTDGAALKGAFLGALLAAGGSKTGQKGINAALFNRPEKLKSLGALIRKKKGLFGTAAVPLMLEAGQ